MSDAAILLDIPEQIDTARLRLSVPRAGDGPALLAAVTDSLAELRAWPANLPWAVPEPELAVFETFCRRSHAQFILRDHLNFLIRTRADNRLVGVCSLHNARWSPRRFEAGFWGRAGTHGQGYVSEAVTALRDLATHTLDAMRVELLTDARNQRARAVAERTGFVLEGVLRRQAREADGTPRDWALYAYCP